MINKRCRCGKANALDGKTKCARCLELARNYQKRKRDTNRIAGLCLNCGRPPQPGKTACVVCEKRATKSTMKRYNINKAAGKCSECGNELGSKSKFRCDRCYNEHIIKNKEYWHRDRIIVLKHYGGKCICCGEDNLEFLEIDHINNNGAEHRKLVGRHMYQWIIKNNYPTDLRILCAGCNYARFKFNICPHIKTPIITEERDIRRDLINYYGGKCICCGENHYEFLILKRIDKKIKNIKLIKNPSLIGKLIPMCYNCEKSNRLYGFCPHSLNSTQI